MRKVFRKNRKNVKSMKSLHEDATKLWRALFSHAGLPDGDWGSCHLCISFIKEKCSGGKDPELCVFGKILKGESTFGIKLDEDDDG